jgi:hypothetical protein
MRPEGIGKLIKAIHLIGYRTRNLRLVAQCLNHYAFPRYWVWLSVRTLVILVEVFGCRLQSLQDNSQAVPRSGHHSFLPSLLQFAVLLSTDCPTLWSVVVKQTALRGMRFGHIFIWSPKTLVVISPNRPHQCKIWGFQNGDYEDWRFLGY